MYAIETEQLYKKFKGRLVVDDLNLQVKQGEIFGFLGPNGAGKSTTVKMLLGLVYPTSGRVYVLGGSPYQAKIRAQMGFLPEQFRFQTWMTAIEFLNFHAHLSGLNATHSKTRIPEVLERVGLLGREKELLSGYSKGMLQRCGLAASMLTYPPVIFLDEPTSALDPIGRVEVRHIIESLKQEGCTIFLNSHLLSEVEQICDSVAFIDKGKVITQGPMEELRKEQLSVRLDIGNCSKDLFLKLGEIGKMTVGDISNLSGCRDIIEMDVSDEAQIPEISSLIHNYDARLYEMTPKKDSLEKVFLKLIGENNNDEE